MSKHEIDIKGLPEGWEPVAYRYPIGNIEYVFVDDEIRQAKPTDKRCLLVRIVQQRRIVLEETGEDNIRYTSGHYANQCIARGVYVADQPKIWREVKEE